LISPAPGVCSGEDRPQKAIAEILPHTHAVVEMIVILDLKQLFPSFRNPNCDY
jgi:hypothetical protein